MGKSKHLASLLSASGQIGSEDLEADAIPASGATTYATIDDLPLTGLTSGALAYISSTDTFYIANGNGWYKVTTINTAPNIANVANSFERSTQNLSNVVIEAVASDAEGIPVSVSYQLEPVSVPFISGTSTANDVLTVNFTASANASGTANVVVSTSDGINISTVKSLINFTTYFGTADFLLLAGGGGGGGIIAGGGGAGGYRTSWGTGADGSGGYSGGISSLETALTLSSGTAYTITVGQGGEGGWGWNAAASNANPHQGRDTSISGPDITTVTSDGGGGGSAYNHNTGAIKDGGSAGGGALGDNSSGTPTTGQGFSGGISGDTNAASGGGGGAGEAGGDSNAGGSNTLGGTGGDGLASTITGTSVVRGGGGSGGARGAAGQYLGDYSTTPIPGGDGGGGVGGILNGRVPWVASGTNNASDGRAGYGGGGGGGAYTALNASTINAGNGGSGIAIFRLPSIAAYSASQLASDVTSASNMTASYLNTQVYTDDPNFNDVVLLLDGDGTSGSTTFTDKSSPPHTITVSGDAQVDTAVKKFGSGSIEFDGTGDYLDVSVDSGLTFDGDFTVEAWVYPNTTASYQPIIDGRASSSAYQNYYFGLANVNGTLRTEVILASGAAGRTGTTNAVPTGQWSHIAWVRSSGVITTYVNGVADATTKTDSATLTPTDFRIGAEVGTSNQYFNGYLDDIRVTKGVARYTTNFTPPTSDLTNTVPSGTVELRMDGTDGAGSGSTTTDLSSFSHTGITSTDVTAGTTDSGVTRPDLYGVAKGYLDFTSGQAGRIVTLPTTVDLSSGDFTIECWVLFDTITDYSSFMRGGTDTSSGTWQLHVLNSNISLAGGNSNYSITDSKTVTTNTWYHVALSYVSSTYTMTLSVDGNSTSLTNQTEFSNMQSSYLGGSGTNIELGANRMGNVRHDGLLTDVRFTASAALYPDLGRITSIPTSALPNRETSTGGDHVILFTVATEDPYDGSTTNDGSCAWTPSF